MALRLSARLGALGMGAVVSVALLVAGGQLGLHGCYSASPMYRAQSAALLDGHLALSDAPEAIAHDLAWTGNGVQQVWGLGVPAWQVPFELAGRTVGVAPFPDRIPLLLWLVLMVYMLVRAWRRDRDEPWWIGGGSILITALMPIFVTIVRGRMGVYEECEAYAYAAAMMLLAGTLRGSTCRWRFLALLAFAGLVALIRPTMGAYGLATAIVASARWLSARGRRGLVEVGIGAVLFAGGGALLYATNATRFGDGLEFGHRLNLESLPGNIHATRFSYPMQQASLGEASLELLTALFDRPEARARGSFYQKSLHHGVSKRVRWREYYFSTYSWPYLPLLLAGIVLGIRAWRRRTGAAGEPPPDATTRLLIVWAVIAILPLLAFYLRAPFISSRYLCDIAPAFAALLVIVWREIAARVASRRRGPLVACATLSILWLVAVVIAQTAEPRSADPIDRDAAVRADAPITQATKYARKFPSAYDLGDAWLPSYTDIVTTFDRCDPSHCLHGVRAADGQQWLVTESVEGKQVSTQTLPPALYLNLYHWNLDTGQMPPGSFAFIDNPRFVELEVSAADGTPIDWVREVRVAVGLVHLKLVGTSPAARGTRLRFEAPVLPTGLTVAFFAFGPDDDLAKPTSQIVVHRIQWR